MELLREFTQEEIHRHTLSKETKLQKIKIKKTRKKKLKKHKKQKPKKKIKFQNKFGLTEEDKKTMRNYYEYMASIKYRKKF